MDDEMDDDFDGKRASKDGPTDEKGDKGKKGAEGSAGDEGGGSEEARGGSRNFRNPRRGARRRKQINSFRVR